MTVRPSIGMSNQISIELKVPDDPFHEVKRLLARNSAVAVTYDLSCYLEN